MHFVQSSLLSSCHSLNFFSVDPCDKSIFKSIFSLFVYENNVMHFPHTRFAYIGVPLPLRFKSSIHLGCILCLKIYTTSNFVSEFFFLFFCVHWTFSHFVLMNGEINRINVYMFLLSEFIREYFPLFSFCLKSYTFYPYFTWIFCVHWYTYTIAVVYIATFVYKLFALCVWKITNHKLEALE